MQHDVTVILGTSGLRLDTWAEYQVRLSMLRPGSPWTFTLYRSDTAESTWQRLRRDLRFGEKVFVSIDGAGLLNGYIGQIKHVTHPNTGETLTIAGQDLAGPALRWHADPRVKLKGLTISDALARLFQPLGITAIVGDHADAARLVQLGTARGPRALRSTSATRRTRPIDFSHPRPGETVWQVAEAIARRAGYMLWTGPHPDNGLTVVLDSPAYDSAPQFEFFRSEREGTAGSRTNILDAEHDVNLTAVPTEVTAFTGSARGAVLPARSGTTVLNGALGNSTVLGGWQVADLLEQPLYVKAERARDPAGATRTAERFIAEANADLRTLRITVKGHGQHGKVYAVNTMTSVRDELAFPEPINERMLILDATFTGSPGAAQTTQLTLGPQGAIVVTPEAS